LLVIINSGLYCRNPNFLKFFKAESTITEDMDSVTAFPVSLHYKESSYQVCAMCKWHLMPSIPIFQFNIILHTYMPSEVILSNQGSVTVVCHNFCLLWYIYFSDAYA